MTAPNHIAGGIVFTGLFCSLYSVNIFQNPVYIIVTIIGCLLPDIDHTKSLIGKMVFPIAKFLMRRFGHRTITHSIFFLIGVSFISVVYDKLFSVDYTISLIVFFSIFSHLLLDMVTVAGIPLFYPIYKNPCVLPANQDLRIRTGNLKQEGIALFVFSLLTIFMQDLFVNGFWSTLNQKFGTIQHLNREFKNTNNFIKVNYNYYEFGDYKQGQAYVLNSTTSTVTLFSNSEIFTINKANSNQKKVNIDFVITDKKYKYETVDFVSKTESEINSLCRYNIVKGTVIGSNSFLLNNSKKIDDEIGLENTYSPYFQFISNDSLKIQLKNELRLKTLRLKTIQKRNSKKINELNNLKDNLDKSENSLLLAKTLYLKNKFENEIIKYNNLIENYNLDIEPTSEIKAEIEFLNKQITTDNPNYFSGSLKVLSLPKKNIKTKKDSIIILENNKYKVHYSNSKNCAIKTIHYLEKSDLKNEKYNRGFFLKDSRLKNPVLSQDYENSGFAKGHLVPCEDMKASVVHFNETFLLSNIVPQTQNFNGGIWLKLEKSIRSYVLKSNERIQIITGCNFSDNDNTISEKNISVPGSFYKIIIQGNNYKHFEIPHKESVQNLSVFEVENDSLIKKGFNKIKNFY